MSFGKTIKVIITIVYNPPFVEDVEDEMDFGKTIKMITTIVYNLPSAEDVKAKRTVIFIMVPVSVVGQ